jgi:adenylate cyclase
VNPPEEEGAWLETNRIRHILHGTCSMGRAAANTLVLDVPKVSRMHALIQVQNIGEFWLVDLGSSNGTFLNKRRASACLAPRPGQDLDRRQTVYFSGTRGNYT